MANRVDLETVYFALPPDFMQKRDGKCLLVWSFLPYWMVVTEQMLSLLTHFNGKRTLDSIINITIGLSDIPRKQYEKKVKDLVSRLLEAKILSIKPEKLVIDGKDNEGLKLEEITVAINDEFRTDTILSTEELKVAIRSTFKHIKGKALLRVVGEKPNVNTEKLLTILKTATYKGLNIILDLPTTAYTEELLNELMKVRVQVQITFDGPYASLNDAIQGEGSFNRSVAVVTNLLSKKIYTIINMNVSEHNHQEIETFLQLANKLKVSECRVIPLKKIGKYKKFRPPDYREIINYLFKAVKKDPSYSKLLGRDVFTIFEQLLTLNENISSCPAGKGQLLLGADGFIYPCIGLKLEQFRVANAQEEHEEDYLETSNILQFLRKQFPVSNSPTCARCIIRFWCRSGCKGETIQNTFKAHNAALSCKSIQSAFIDMFWSISEYEELIKPRQPFC